MFAEGWMPRGPRVMVMRADGSEVEPLPLRYEGWAEPLAWAPDSGRILVGGGNSQHDCSMLLASASGETSVLLEGTTVLATQHLEPGETPAATGDPCVQSASWTPWSTIPVPTAEDIVEGRAPIGEPLAELLGLKLEPSFEGALPCAYWQGIGEAGGYCLADLDVGEIDRYAIAVALRGHRITQDELAGITDAFSGQGLGVGDPPIAMIPLIQERITSVEMELASLDTTTPEGRAKDEVLTAQVAALEAALVDLCQQAGSPGICTTP